MKNILITGGAGFIGSNLVDLLLAEGNWKVTVIDNFDDYYNPFIKHKNIASHIRNSDYTLESGDILSKPFLDEVFTSTKFDLIVHLAAKVGIRSSLSNPHSYAETNIQGTINLLEFAKKYEVKKFIFASSSSVYGNNCKVPFTETDLVNQPISPYAMTKATGELICHTFSQLYDLPCVCLRFFTVYGPRQRPDLAIHKFTRLILINKPIQVFGDGYTKRDYTYISDVVQGIRAAIDYNKTNFEIFNLGNSRPIKLSKLIRIIGMSLKREAIIKRVPLQPGDAIQTFADISKAKRLLDYHPKISIENGVNKFIDWFKKENFSKTFPKKSKNTFSQTRNNFDQDKIKIKSLYSGSL
jgi:UDP-glucuronate 4-epimerase